MGEHVGSGQGAPSRRALLARIGAVAGSAAMYQAMSALGVAAESAYRGPIELDGDPRGATVGHLEEPPFLKAAMLHSGCGFGGGDGSAGVLRSR